MSTQLSRWGHSLAVRIPKPLADQAQMHEGDELNLSVATDGSITIRRARPKITLDELIDGITPENRHEETDWGPPAGKELW